MQNAVVADAGERREVEFAVVQRLAVAGADGRSQVRRGRGVALADRAGPRAVRAVAGEAVVAVVDSARGQVGGAGRQGADEGKLGTLPYFRVRGGKIHGADPWEIG